MIVFPSALRVGTGRFSRTWEGRSLCRKLFPSASPRVLTRSVTSGNESGAFGKRYGGQTHRELPDFVEKWGRGPFYAVGAVAGAGSVAAGTLYGGVWWAVAPLAGAYWWIGLKDISSNQPIRRNFPVLGHMRYLLESIRPEIRQYFIESDQDSVPFSRERRSVVYQRSKGIEAVQSFGTRRDTEEIGYEFMSHSNLSSVAPTSAAKARVTIGANHCTMPYDAALLNISAMSYGALSKNAVLALNEAAKIGGFYHNTGEGAISPWHKQPGGDIVWNIGTGYFGCRTLEGEFCEKKFAENAALPQVKMIEVKLSQGAKPGHGGLLPASKLSAEIAEIRGLPMGKDVHSPAYHSAFTGPSGLVRWMGRLREISGKPVGFKFCVGSLDETASMIRAMHELKDWPDFITVDGGEGGTGAAPPDFQNHVGRPLSDGLPMVDDLLRGAGLRDKVKIICSGKITNPFNIVRALALGADVCNSARGMMFALGCIQALKCNTNKCPTGITTQDPALQEGLVVPYKATRVAGFQQKTVQGSLDLIAASGLAMPDRLGRTHINKRVSETEILTLADLYPIVPDGALITGRGAPAKLQAAWDRAATTWQS